MSADSPKALSVKGLQKTYAGGHQALKGIDLDVAAGDFFALLGPNGAGKSTLIGIISTLVRRTAGQVSIFGHDLFNSPAEAKRLVGVVPQEFNFSNFETPLQIVTNQAGYYGVDYSKAKQRAEQLLKQLELWDKRDEQSRMLSGGMRRRLMIARALVHEPKLLILDEPTAGVDIELRRSLWSFLRDTNARGTSIILTTHYLEEAEQLCRSIAIIDHGQIIENTSMRALLRKLDVQTYVLELAEPVDTLPTVEGFTLRQIDESTLELDVPQQQTISEAMTKLNTAGLAVASLRNKANRLEELFVRLTSKAKPEAA